MIESEQGTTKLVYIGKVVTSEGVRHRYYDEGNDNQQIYFKQTLTKKRESHSSRFLVRVQRDDSGQLKSVSHPEQLTYANSDPYYQSLRASIVESEQKVIEQKALEKIDREIDTLGDTTLRELREQVRKSFGSSRKLILAAVIEYITR